MDEQQKVRGPASYFPSIEKTYGQPIAHWLALLAGREERKHMALVAWLKAEHGMGLIMITHNIGVVAETADRVVVQYKGRKMEEAGVLELFTAPKSPYTRALLAALPENATGDRLPTVSGFNPEELAV